MKRERERERWRGRKREREGEREREEEGERGKGRKKEREIHVPSDCATQLHVSCVLTSRPWTESPPHCGLYDAHSMMVLIVVWGGGS